MSKPFRAWAALPCALLLACGGGGGGSDEYAPGEDGGRALDKPPGAAPTVTLSPPDTGDGWEVSTPDAQEMDVVRLEQALNSLRTNGSNGMDGIVVVRNARLVAEAYYNGYDRSTIHDVRSVTKSITSALTGIAIERGIIGLEDSIAQHVPNFERYPVDDQKRAIRISHLLNMQSGLDCDDWIDSSPGNESKMYGKDDWVNFTLSLSMTAAPGARMTYCSAGVMLLGHIIAARSGMKLEDFSANYLFGPLGIQNVRWLHSPQGVTNANSTFQIRPRDAAKFGSLYLDGGRWKGLPVVPESWISRSFTQTGAMRGEAYGWLWWKTNFLVRGVVQPVLYASGNGGNLIFVLPTEQLVVVITASNYNRSSPSYAFMRDVILPTVQ